uniref:Uncharacterized protein n=1 Tax=viral metagenome TaxID=1070528 RepID=A0A6C0C8Y4_9ZZZZ
MSEKKFNPNKKKANPKLNYTEPGKSTRTKKKKPIDERIGRENGRSHKKTCTESIGYKICDPTLLKSVKRNAIQSEIETGLDPAIPYRSKTSSYGCRVCHIEKSSYINPEIHSRCKRICGSIKPFLTKEDVETTKNVEDVKVNRFWKISPAQDHLLVFTEYCDPNSRSRICLRSPFGGESDEPYRIDVTKVKI